MDAGHTSKGLAGPDGFVLQRNIIQWPDERLTKVADPFPEDEDPGPLLDEMAEIVRCANAWGLAAPQLGRNVRAIVVKVPGAAPLALIDPVIVKRMGHRRVSYEGCLSYAAGLPTVKVLRFPKIEVYGLDRNREPVRHTSRIYEAAAVQHEIDHLNGINIAVHPSRQ